MVLVLILLLLMKRVEFIVITKTKTILDKHEFDLEGSQIYTKINEYSVANYVIVNPTRSQIFE